MADNVEQVSYAVCVTQREREGVLSNEIGVIAKYYGYEVLVQFEP